MPRRHRVASLDPHRPDGHSPPYLRTGEPTPPHGLASFDPPTEPFKPFAPSNPSTMPDTVIDAKAGPAEPILIGLPLVIIYVLMGVAFFLLS